MGLEKTPDSVLCLDPDPGKEMALGIALEMALGIALEVSLGMTLGIALGIPRFLPQKQTTIRKLLG